jgi:hypothetical protein
VRLTPNKPILAGVDDRADGADGVADEAWTRVRALADKVAQLEAAAAEMIDPDPDTLARLDRARYKAAKAAQRASLADALADHLDDIRARRVNHP